MRTPTPIPKWFNAWQVWRDAGSPKGKRPKNAPKFIPLWAWWRRRQLRRKPQATKPSPPPSQPPPAPPSVFAGKGLFTTHDADCVSGHPCDWVALQMDPEGDDNPQITNNPARIMYWQARPTTDMVGNANRLGIPYIAQAESMPELEVAIGTQYRGGNQAPLPLMVPKGLVGNPAAWTTPGASAEAARQGWDLILEWYWNAQPNYRSPNAGGYPRFVNVCFGTYDAASEQPDGRRVSVASYRAVWQGSFSCWPAEALEPGDWAVFDAV
jgi:hypothetical protein